METKYDDIIPKMNGAIWIRAAVCLREGGSPDDALKDWWCNVFPDLVTAERGRIVRRPRVVRALSKRKARRIEYRCMQRLWRINMTKAAHKVLDGDTGGLPHPTLAEQFVFWRPVFGAESVGRLQAIVDEGRAELEGVWSPITKSEVINIRLPSASAPGLDGMTVWRWFTDVPAILRVAIFNIIIATDSVPSRFRHSRTVLIPKSADLIDPACYRPISVSSVVLRHFHKILARRLAGCNLLDARTAGLYVRRWLCRERCGTLYAAV